MEPQQQPKIEEKLAITDPSQRKEEKKIKEPFSPKQMIDMFKFYILPIISIGIFFVIVILGLYPTFTDIFNSLTQIESLSQEFKDQEARVTQLKSLRDNQTRSLAYLALIESLVPSESTEVVNFQQKIKALALSNGLVVNEPTTGETIIAPTEGTLGIIEIPSKFLVVGELDDIKKFLTELDKGEDFLIIKEMELTRLEDNEWNMEITFVKYQFQKNEDEKIFQEVPETSEPDKEVLEFIKEHYGDGHPLL